MRLSDFCNRLSTRAPCVPPDSRSRSRPPRGLATPPRSDSRRSARNHRTRLAPFQQLRRISGGASLDGDSPASASPQSPVERSGAETPSVRLFEHSLALVELDRAPPNRASRRRLSRPRAEHAARPLTPSVATTPFELCISAAPALATARLRLHRRFVKSDCFVETRTPSLDEYALPRSSTRRRLSLPPDDLTGSSRIRHRTFGFAADGRLRALFSPAKRARDMPKPHSTG